ncbi:cation:proton antiporter [Pseudoalteromonas sp. T1lg65]|uniref:cation:proton antiporter n=1 Tax=Pseudoalteromonas sp. T1lg65 TaxID=2077101 RepID=UPI003F79BA36
MIYTFLAFTGLSIFIYSISARQLDRAELTAPMWFVVTGAIIGLLFPKMANGDGAMLTLSNLQNLLPVIELVLAIYLFSDAAKTRLRVLAHSFSLPVVLLLGLPFTLLLAAVSAHFMFELSWLSCFLIAAVITPTDATLCKTFIRDKQVPSRLREAINVESGLNDGLCVPVFLFFLGAVSHRLDATTGSLIKVFITEIGVALLLSVVLTFTVIGVLKKAYEHHLFALKSSPYLFVGIAILVFSVTQVLHGSGFVAAFISGLIFDKYYQDPFKDQLIEEGEHLAEFSAYLIWVVFGVATITVFSSGTSWSVWLYALLATTCFRLIPVFILLFDKKLTVKERFTLSWFGPKGLASVVLILLLLSEVMAEGRLMTQIAVATVLLSIFVFGFSSRPISRLFSHVKDS